MKFLIDNALSPLVADLLRRNGHDAIHVGERNLGTAPDEILFDLAATEERCIVSADTDFGEILANRSSRIPSVILFRQRSHRRPQEMAEILTRNLPAILQELGQGAIVIIEDDRIRIRSLPLQKPG